MKAREKVILFDHVDNVLEDLALSDAEILECIPAIQERLLDCQKILNDNVTTEEYDKYGEANEWQNVIGATRKAKPKR